jgi:hypothetical protein
LGVATLLRQHRAIRRRRVRVNARREMAEP